MIRSTHDGYSWGAMHGEVVRADDQTCGWGDGYEVVLGAGWGNAYGGGHGTGYWHGDYATGSGQGLAFDER